MASSSLARTTAEGTFNVKTWRAATTTSEIGVDHPRQPHPPTPNYHVTQGPHLFSESHLYAPPSVHFKSFFFFSTWKKKMEEKKIQTKEQAEKKTPATFFSFLFWCWPSTHLRMRGKVPEDLLDPLTVAHGTPCMRQVRWLQIHENICTQWIYFYRSWGFQYIIFYDVKLTQNHCEEKKVSGTLVKNRSVLGCGKWCHCGTDDWQSNLVFLSVFQKKKKKKQ